MFDNVHKLKTHMKMSIRLFKGGGRPLIGGGGGLVFIYSCSALLIPFEIDCFYALLTRIYEYEPPPPINGHPPPLRLLEMKMKYLLIYFILMFKLIRSNLVGWVKETNRH